MIYKYLIMIKWWKSKVHVRNDYYEDNTDVKKDSDDANPAVYNTGIAYENLTHNTDNNGGEKVSLSEIFIQVLDDASCSQYRLAFNDYDNVALIEIPEKLLDPRVLKDDILTIYGEFQETVPYELTMGGDITVSAIVVDKFEIFEKSEQ